MFYNRGLFAELFGFVVLDLAGLIAFQREHNLGDDVLSSFTTLNLGQQVSENGLAIPITGLSGYYYYWAVCDFELESSHLKDAQIVIKSSDWLFYTAQGEAVV